jgi:hypothetical protein
VNVTVLADRVLLLVARGGPAAAGANCTDMAAVRITSGPLRGVELETAVGSPTGRALRRALRTRRRRRLGHAPVLTPPPVEETGPRAAA